MPAASFATQPTLCLGLPDSLQQRLHQRLADLQRMLGGPGQALDRLAARFAELVVGFVGRGQRQAEVDEGIFQAGAFADGEQRRVGVVAGGEMGVGGAGWIGDGFDHHGVPEK